MAGSSFDASAFESTATSIGRPVEESDAPSPIHPSRGRSRDEFRVTAAIAPDNRSSTFCIASAVSAVSGICSLNSTMSRLNTTGCGATATGVIAKFALKPGPAKTSVISSGCGRRRAASCRLAFATRTSAPATVTQ